jgi:glycosyl transferase family 87
MAEFVQKRKFLITVFLLAMAFCNLAMPFQGKSGLRTGYQDFTIYYMSGLLLRNGQASDLYNLNTQYRTQLTFAHVPIRQGPLPYNHPPFEALIFIPFTLLAYWPAYLLWTALNLTMLAASVIILRRQFPGLVSVSPLTMGLGAIAFFPVVIGILQGQDVILLELLFVLAVVSLDRGNDAMAGAFLAAGLFLPHLIMPVVVLFAARRWRVLLGFVPVTLFLGGLSVAIMGWRGPFDYLRFVLHVEKSTAVSYGPQVAPNLRGLIADLPGLNATSPWTAVLIFAASAVVFLVALRRIRNGRNSMMFLSSLAAVTAILISFHALSYDLTLLLPAALWLLSGAMGGELEKKKIAAATFGFILLLFLSPLYVFLLIVAKRFFWYSLILLCVYLKLVLAPVPARVTSSV